VKGLVPVDNDRRGRPREHPKALQITHAHTQGNPEGVTWTSVTSGSHGTCTTTIVRKKRGNWLRMRRTYFRSLPVTSLLVAPHSTFTNITWAVPIYYIFGYVHETQWITDLKHENTLRKKGQTRWAKIGLCTSYICAMHCQFEK
jgi:hypothetical protein